MLELCSYETVALGYSSFCPLFSQEDFLNYEYFFDLVSPTSTSTSSPFLRDQFPN